jgi:hypothetical protein
MKRSLLVSLVLVASLVLASYAAEPPGKPTGAGNQPPIPPTPGNAPLSFPEQMISGSVTDAGSKPLGGVAIKLFASGALVQVTHTTPSGAYELRVPLNLERDETVVLWFVSTTEPLMPQAIVLKQSGLARSAGLFSPCTRETKMRTQMRVDVKLLTESEAVASLRGKGCL